MYFIDGCKFDGMRLKMDKKMRDSAGLESEKRHIEILSLEGENSMQEIVIRILDIPDKLRNTLLYLVGLNFAVRLGARHYSLSYAEKFNASKPEHTKKLSIQRETSLLDLKSTRL